MARLLRNVAMDPCQLAGGSERQLACQHAVQQDTQRVEIAAVVNLGIEAADTLGREVSSSVCVRNAGGRAVLTCVAHVDEAGAAECQVGQDVGRA
ncbi:MAG TPA: hypothetical protein VMK12_19420 [Anaeromyxobacteraceae bacterium]|nr:hypothetical protein [Anaeromyxobacteraceae bacterium]